MDNPQLQRPPLPSADTIADRIKGAIFGAICANSLAGSSIGLNYKEIAGTVGLSGLRDFAPGLSRSFLPDHKAGELLADSYMALALGESLIAGAGKFDSSDLKKRLEALLTDSDFLKTSPGVPCIAALRHMADGAELAKEGAEATHANVAARVFPAGCLPGLGKSCRRSRGRGGRLSPLLYYRRAARQRRRCTQLCGPRNGHCSGTGSTLRRVVGRCCTRPGLCSPR
jgi:hypothetical protein